MEKASTFIILFVLMVTFQIMATEIITLFQNEDFDDTNADKLTLSVPEGVCINLESRWNDEISSIEPNEACVMLYDRLFCKGKGFKLSGQSIGKLTDVGFNDMASSLKLC